LVLQQIVNAGGSLICQPIARCLPQ